MMGLGLSSLPSGREVQFSEMGLVLICIGEMIVAENLDFEVILQDAKFVNLLEQKLLAKGADPEFVTCLIKEAKDDIGKPE